LKSSSSKPNLTSLGYVRGLLAGHEIHPNRVLGQCFLIDRNILTLIMKAGEVTGDDVVLEIGPGLGVVTEELLKRARSVVAVEKDTRLAPLLREALDEPANLELVWADALDLDLGGEWMARFTKVVSNLPYSAGARILAEIVRGPRPPGRMVVMVQREVADRISAPAGTKDRGTLGVWIQARYETETVKRVSRTCFWPPPEVESSLVCLRRREKSLVKPEFEGQYFALTKAMFQHRRKQMGKLLAGVLTDPATALRDSGIPPASRPEQLTIEQWCRLAECAAPEKETR